jgi:hypothetical protein
MSIVYISENEVICELVSHIQRKFSHEDIRNIYRIINLLLEFLTEDGKYNYHYNKHHIIMQCLYRFYQSYPCGNVTIHSYSAYISERLREIRRNENRKKMEKDNGRISCRHYCVIL